LFERLKAKSKQRTTMFKFIIVSIVSIASEVVNNNVNLKTKTISAKLEINYYFVFRYNCTLRRSSNLDNKKEFLKLILR